MSALAHPLLLDLAHDRLVSNTQAVNRYGRSAYRELTKLEGRGQVIRFDFPGRRGRRVQAYHLSKVGAVRVADIWGLPIRSIPVTPGPVGHARHTLLVGEVRWRLKADGLQLKTDYQNNVETYRVGGRQTLHPDVYVMREGEPEVAVEVDRGYRPCEIQAKLSDWADRDLKVWWFSEGAEQWNRLNSYEFYFDRLMNIDELGWRVY